MTTEITDSGIFIDGATHSQRSAMLLYVPTDAVQSGQFPLIGGTEYRGLALPDVGVVLTWTAGDPPEFPIIVDEPNPADVPWPLGDFLPSESGDSNPADDADADDAPTPDSVPDPDHPETDE